MNSEGKNVLTVSELTSKIKNNLEANFPNVWIEGEISNMKISYAGHMYFTLKDEQSQLKCVMFRYRSRHLSIDLKDGLLVFAGGRITVYGKRGDYQLQAEMIEIKGHGTLQLAFEQLKKSLEKEGLFDRRHKKDIPVIPMRIGVVTSPTGAAIRDILDVAGRRFSGLSIMINPVRVQGEGSAAEIANAVSEFDEIGNVDVIIVARGGGSLEDLWAFNEEIVARSIFECKIPVISGIGHEIDYTITDFVADIRAATPSAAAEIVVAEEEKIIKTITENSDRITIFIEHYLSGLKDRVMMLYKGYGFRRFEDFLSEKSLHVDNLTETLTLRMEHNMGLLMKNIENMRGKLASLNPESILRRGYSLALKLPERSLIKQIDDVEKTDHVEIQVSDGVFETRVEEKTPWQKK